MVVGWEQHWLHQGQGAGTRMCTHMACHCRVLARVEGGLPHLQTVSANNPGCSATARPGASGWDVGWCEVRTLVRGLLGVEASLLSSEGPAEAKPRALGACQSFGSSKGVTGKVLGFRIQLCLTLASHIAGMRAAGVPETRGAPRASGCDMQTNPTLTRSTHAQTTCAAFRRRTTWPRVQR